MELLVIRHALPVRLANDDGSAGVAGSARTASDARSARLASRAEREPCRTGESSSRIVAAAQHELESVVARAGCPALDAAEERELCLALARLGGSGD